MARFSYCECADAGCAGDHGSSIGPCGKVAITTLYRVDMEDATGTDMCVECSDDALDSGVFTDVAPGEEEEDDDA